LRDWEEATVLRLAAKLQREFNLIHKYFYGGAGAIRKQPVPISSLPGFVITPPNPPLKDKGKAEIPDMK
jgi:hypothetical protein